MVGLNRFGLSYLGPVVLLLPNTLDYLAFQSYLLILSAPDEGYYVPDEGYYVPMVKDPTRNSRFKWFSML
jgi:hypothetical protein